MTAEISRRLFTADEYHKLGDAGVLSEDDRVELIDGELVEMSPIGRRHAACVNRLTRIFTRFVGDSSIVSVQNPLALVQRSEPQPDVMLLRPRADFYASGHPGPSDVLLIIEVAESSVEFDREVKIPRYAETGVIEVWLVDLTAGEILIHRNPAAGGYADVQSISSGVLPAPQGFPGLRLTTKDILGQPPTGSE